MTTLPTRRQTVTFPTIAGPSGYSLTGYVWQYDLVETVDSRGEDRVVRVSDWSRAEAADVTGRDIVHQFSVVAPDGHGLTVSLESAAKLLGFVPGTEGAKTVKSISSAVKTLAKLRMEKAAIDAENAGFAAKNAEHAADLERITAEVAKLTHTVKEGPSPRIEIWELDGQWCWYHQEGGDPSWVAQGRARRLADLRKMVAREHMHALGHTNGIYLAHTSYGDLLERIARQERKIAKFGK